MGEKIVDKLICILDVDENERDIIIYGLDIFLHNLMTTITFLFLGMVTNTLLETVLFLIIHVVVQRKAGGYHATTRIGCFLATAAAWSGVVLVAGLQEQYQFLSFPVAVLVCAGMIIVTSLYAPVEHKNKPLTREVRKKNRIISIILMACFSILLLVLWFYLPVASVIILGTLLETTILLFIAKGGEAYVS